MSANGDPPSTESSAPPHGASSYGQTGSGYPPVQQWPDYNAAYAAYYQPPPANYGQYGAPPGQPPPPAPYPPYPNNAQYGQYPPQQYPNASGVPPPPDGPKPNYMPEGNSAVKGPPHSESSSGNDGNSATNSNGSAPPGMNPQQFYPPHPPYNPNNQQSYYNYGPPPSAYGQPQGPYPPPHPPNPYPPGPGQYNTPAPQGYPPQGPPNSPFNRPPRPFNRNVNQPPAWTNDPGTIKVEGFPTDITLDELRSTFNVGALKKDQYSGYEQICVSPDRQCAFVSFEDPTVAEAAVVMLNESSIRGQKIAVSLYDGNYHNQGFKRRNDDNYESSGYGKRPCFDQNNSGGGGYNNFRPDRGPNWPCVACNASNHGHRWNCYKCRTPKPDLDKGGAPPGFDPNFPASHNRTAEDWICSSCNNHNFAKRLVCNRCKLPKPANPTLAPMTGANNTPLGAKPSYNFTPPFAAGAAKEGWKCEPCGTSNDMTKLVCSKCQHPKPGIPQKTLDVLAKLNAIKGSSSASNGQSSTSGAGSRWGENK